MPPVMHRRQHDRPPTIRFAHLQASSALTRQVPPPGAPGIHCGITLRPQLEGERVELETLKLPQSQPPLPDPIDPLRRPYQTFVFVCCRGEED